MYIDYWYNFTIIDVSDVDAMISLPSKYNIHRNSIDGRGQLKLFHYFIEWLIQAGIYKVYKQAWDKYYFNQIFFSCIPVQLLWCINLYV